MAFESRSTLTFARICACAVFSIVAFAACAQTASAKGDVRAYLVRPIPADAEPGSTITANWTLVSVRNNVSEPFGAGEIYFRLVGREPGQKSEAIVDGLGSFSARVKVPPSGIRRVEIGIIGSRGYRGGEMGRVYSPFPIYGPSLDNSSSDSTGLAHNFSTVFLGLVGIFALGLLAAFLFGVRRLSPSTAP